MDTVQFILDAHIPDSAGDALRRLGFSYARVQDVLGDGVDDKVIAQWAEQHHATVVSKNWRHFNPYTCRRPTECPNKFRHAGLLSVNCEQRKLAGRIDQVGNLIKSECDNASTRRDTRVFLELGIESVKFIR